MKIQTGKLLLILVLSCFAAGASASNDANGSSSQLVDTVLLIPQFNQLTTVHIYLPEGYKSGQHYPVLYMPCQHDIFGTPGNVSDSWNVNLALDSLAAKGKTACIVVGFEQVPDTSATSNDPAVMASLLGRRVKGYADFLTLTLKPYIDQHYHTIAGKENTMLAAADTGALVSYYAMLNYPDIFGKAGIFSPPFLLANWGSTWLDQAFNDKSYGKFFFYWVQQDVPDELSSLNLVNSKLGNASNTLVYVLEDADGANDINAWRKWFPEFYNWITADGFNYVMKGE